MVEQEAKQVEILWVYSEKDKDFKVELEKQLKSDSKEEYICHWHDREVLEEEWEGYVDNRLTIHIILLLISPDLLSSKYYSGNEMQQAYYLYDEKLVHIIPVILRPVGWKRQRFGKLKVLPENGIPITSYKNQDQALFEVAEGIYASIEKFLVEIIPALVKMGKDYVDSKNFPMALKYYDRAISFVNCDPALYAGKGNILVHLHKYEEALIAYEQAISYDKENSRYYKEKGDILRRLQRFEEAVAAYEEALHFEPGNSEFYFCKGHAFLAIDSYENALAAYEKAINLGKRDAQVWRNKGKALFCLQHFEEALAAYEEAFHLDPDQPYLYKERGDILAVLGRLEEALTDYEKALLLDPQFGRASLSQSIVLIKLAEQTYDELMKRARQAYEQAKQRGATKCSSFEDFIKRRE
jgi:tetratricopeptide (TPR) repeat protein